MLRELFFSSSSPRFRAERSQLHPPSSRRRLFRAGSPTTRSYAPSGSNEPRRPCRKDSSATISVVRRSVSTRLPMAARLTHRRRSQPRVPERLVQRSVKARFCRARLTIESRRGSTRVNLVKASEIHSCVSAPNVSEWMSVSFLL